jgi:hypothetical protein|tara:strand:+ start:17718 stop:17924 length:207 start_codon:yes stop_codon:yes gene_type:complete
MDEEVRTTRLTDGSALAVRRMLRVPFMLFWMYGSGSPLRFVSVAMCAIPETPGEVVSGLQNVFACVIA